MQPAENPLTNRFPAPCTVCGARVPAGAGTLKGPPWTVTCATCLGGARREQAAPAAAPPAPAADKPGRIRISLEPDGRTAFLHLEGFLGPDKFATYRAATSGARYDAGRKGNVARIDQLPAMLDTLHNAGFTLVVDDGVQRAVQQLTAGLKADFAAAQGRLEAIDAALRARGLALYAYQREGVQWLSARINALLADGMGLGKSAQSLLSLPDRAPVLVICPVVVKLNWRNEAAKWRPDYRVSVLGTSPEGFRWPAAGEIVITGYSNLPEESAIPAAPSGVVVIGDEIHLAKGDPRKTARTRRTHAMMSAALNAGGRAWGLSGTPLLNQPKELWTVLDNMRLTLDAFGSWKEFVRLFHGFKGRFGMEWGEPDPSVPDRLKRVMLRRTKDQVLQDLPPKRYQEIPFELDEKTRAMADALLAELEAAGIDLEGAIETAEGTKLGRVLFEKMSALRAALATAKIPAMLQVVEEFEEQDTPLVVFSAHRAPIDTLGKRAGWVTITGDTSPEERQSIVDSFQGGQYKGVALTIKAGGVGITLTRASNELFVDLMWTPADNEQAEDRCVLHGQTVQTLRGPVLVENVVAGDRVLTHTGRWVEVRDAWSRQHRGLMTEIRYTRFPDPLVVTHDHRLLVRRKDSEEIGWAPAHTLLPGDLLVMPRMRFADFALAELSVPDNLRLPVVQTNQFGVQQQNGRRKLLPDKIEIDDDLCRIFGWYLAEGFASTEGGKGRFISFGLNGETERPVADWIADYFHRKFDLNSHIRHEEKLGPPRKDGKPRARTLEVRVFCADLAFLFERLFGDNAHTKKIDSDLLTSLSREQVALVVDGYFRGDGYARKNQQHWTTVSKTLLYQIGLITAGLGFAPSIRPHKSCDNAYVGMITKGGRPDNPRLDMVDDQYVYHPVRSVRTRHARRHDEQEMVRDLSVDGDESFVVGLAVVHNCHRIGQQDAVLIKSLVATHPLDARVYELLRKKQVLISATIEAAALRKGEHAPGGPVIPEIDFGALAVAAQAEIEESDRRRAAAVANRQPPPPPVKFRAPQTPKENWAAAAIIRLSNLDPDRALARNEVGWNAMDGAIGHSLADQLKERGGLTDKQWALATKIVSKYWRQIGRPPE